MSSLNGCLLSSTGVKSNIRIYTVRATAILQFCRNGAKAGNFDDDEVWRSSNVSIAENFF